MENKDLATIEQVLIKGDLSTLNVEQRLSYVKQLCELTGLNILTNPFKFISLQGRLVLYADKGCAEQLRKVHGVGVSSLTSQTINGVYVVTAKAVDKSGREDSATGAVTIDGLKGDSLANALMKAETKAKRRVTLSICGLGMLDESELETIPGAHPMQERKVAPPPLPVLQAKEEFYYDMQDLSKVQINYMENNGAVFDDIKMVWVSPKKLDKKLDPYLRDPSTIVEHTDHLEDWHNEINAPLEAEKPLDRIKKRVQEMVVNSKGRLEIESIQEK